MRYIYTILALILIGLLIYVLWPRTELKDIDVTQLRELQTKLQRAENKRTEIIVKAREDSAKQALITKAKDAEITRLKQAVRKSRTPHVDTVLIQDKEVGRYAAFLDSLVVEQDSQIAQLKEQKHELQESFNALVLASDSVVNRLNEVHELELSNEKKRTKKAKNKRFGIGPHVGYDLRNQVTGGVSINFDVFSF